jgi:hypothetical protein
LEPFGQKAVLRERGATWIQLDAGFSICVDCNAPWGLASWCKKTHCCLRKRVAATLSRKREVNVDTLLGLRTWKWRATDWTAAAVSGFAAGALLMVLDLVWSAVFNPDGPWRTSYMIAPVFTGPQSLQTSGFEFSVGVVAISLITHYVLGVIFGLAMAAMLAQFSLDSTAGRALGAGAILGVALYLINFDLLIGFFPWLAALRGADTLVAHVVFGVVAALLYFRLKRAAAEL